MLIREYPLTSFRDGISVRLHNLLTHLLAVVPGNTLRRDGHQTAARPPERGDGQ